MTADGEKVVSLAEAIIKCIRSDTDYSHMQLEDRLTELIHTLLQSKEEEMQWAGLMTVDRTVEQAVRVARKRNMADTFVGSLAGQIKIASM